MGQGEGDLQRQSCEYRGVGQREMGAGLEPQFQPSLAVWPVPVV